MQLARVRKAGLIRNSLLRKDGISTTRIVKSNHEHGGNSKGYYTAREASTNI